MKSSKLLERLKDTNGWYLVDTDKIGLKVLAERVVITTKKGRELKDTLYKVFAPSRRPYYYLVENCDARTVPHSGKIFNSLIKAIEYCERN